MFYKTRYVWNDNGLCDVSHLLSGRRCRLCGMTGRFLINVGKKKYEHLGCSVLKGGN
jgi:hypothetical protein